MIAARARASAITRVRGTERIPATSCQLVYLTFTVLHFETAAGQDGDSGAVARIRRVALRNLLLIDQAPLESLDVPTVLRVFHLPPMGFALA